MSIQNSNAVRLLEQYRNAGIDSVTLTAHVAGISFRGIDKELQAIRERNFPVGTFTLIPYREHNNEYDAFAVRLYLKTNFSDKEVWVGYVPADRSELVSYVLDNPDEYSIIFMNVQFYGGTPDKPNVGIYYDYVINIFPKEGK